MTTEQIEAMGPALADFLNQFLFCCGYTQNFDHLGVYCRGLLSDLPRKSVEPIALAAGVPVRTLQEFLRDLGWDQDQVRDLLQRHVASTLAELPDDDLGTVGLIDETGTAKKGTKTPGVQRQHCGELGKIENCIVTVHVGVCKGHYKTLVDRDLFLPEWWDRDRERCRAVGIPDELHYRPKWHIALGQVARAKRNGLSFDWMTFDEGYGQAPRFLLGLDRLKLHYVGEVPRLFRCFASKPRAGQPSSKAEDVVRHSPAFWGQPWRSYRLKRQTLGDQHWQAKAARVWLGVEGRPSVNCYWLIWARNERTGEEKFFISNAPAGTTVGKMLRVAFTRWNVEHALRVSKGELGFRHYEGRNYIGLMRHLTLCELMLTFAASQAEGLRGEKSGGDAGTGLSRPEPAVLALAGADARNDGPGIHRGSHQLPPEAEPGRPDFAPAPPGRSPRRLPAHQPAHQAPSHTQTSSETLWRPAVAL